MKTRYIAALAASSLTVAVVAPSAAHAAAAKGDTHPVVGRGLGVVPTTAKPAANAFPRKAVGRTVKSTAGFGTLTAVLTANATGGEGFEFDGTGSTDTITAIMNYTINFGDGSGQTNTTGIFAYKYAWAGTYTVTLTVFDSTGVVSVAQLNVTTSGSDYTAYGPTRILDTRNGTGAAGAAVAANGVVRLKVAGAGIAGDPIPAGVTAVAMNVTVTNPTSAGYITAYPEGTDAPNASNVNYGAGQTIPDLVVAQVGADGNVDLKNSSTGTVQLIADVVGYYTQTQASQYTAISPYRLLDTRQGTGTNGVVKQIPGGGSITVQVGGANAGTIPSGGLTAVAANITVTAAKSNGFITAYPDGESLPTASNVNYGQAQTIPNMAIIPVGSDGKIVVHNTSSAGADVIIDVSGYYQNADITGTSNTYIPNAPDRVLDTRTWDNGGDAPLKGFAPYALVGFPTASGITSAVFTATVTNPQTGGFLTFYPYNSDSTSNIPTASNLNYGGGQTIANLAFASLGTTPISNGKGGTEYWFGGMNSSTGSTDLILDQEGAFYDN